VSTALLLIDWVNPMDFEEAPSLMPHALAAAERVALLRHRARLSGVPVVYVNDNYGRWQVGFRELVEQFRSEGVPGLPIIEKLLPDSERDLFVLKPMHSGFFCTSLDVLLGLKNVRRLILTGLQGSICVFFTANDAYMRRYEVVVPSDCVASETVEENRYALRLMAKVLKADTRPSGELTFHRNANGR
jgi:nicotinamidase-related amidase